MKLELTLEQTAKGFSLRCSRSDGAELNRQLREHEEAKSRLPRIIFIFDRRYQRSSAQRRQTWTPAVTDKLVNITSENIRLLINNSSSDSLYMIMLQSIF